MQGNKNNGQHGKKRHYGTIALADAYEVHQFIAAQDMFTMEDAIDLVIANNRGLDRAVEIPAQGAESTLNVLHKIPEILLAMQDNKEEQDNLQRVGHGCPERTAAKNPQTTPNPPMLGSDGTVNPNPRPQAAGCDPLAPSFREQEKEFATQTGRR